MLHDSYFQFDLMIICSSNKCVNRIYYHRRSAKETSVYHLKLLKNVDHASIEGCVV